MESTENTEKQTVGSVALRWWHGIATDRGSRSNLRRASSPSEVMLQPAFYDLLGEAKRSDVQVNALRLACVAGVLAHIVTHDGSNSIGERCARVFSSGDSGDLRFRRLLALRGEREELFTSMVRLVRLLKGEGNVVDLADKVYWWNERARRDLGYDFYTNYRA